MNVNIYYGGRGLVDDPTIVVINRIQEVLEELNVHVTRYNLYEIKNTITLLDSCWLYADKSRTSSTYMFPVVMSRAYGEREVVTALSNSWEIIGGVVGESLSAYVDDTTDFEFNNEYKEIIEKYAENIYRTISKGLRNLPSSSQTIRKNVIKEVVNFTPQESEQLSKYASDDEFVKTQKEDIESLASIYKELLSDEQNGGDDYYLSVFRNHFKPQLNYNGRYMFMISDKDKNIIVDVQGSNLTVEFGQDMEADVIGKMSKETFDRIVQGRITFHRAFMTGDMTAKGNFRTLRMLDEVFNFED